MSHSSTSDSLAHGNLECGISYSPVELQWPNTLADTTNDRRNQAPVSQVIVGASTVELSLLSAIPENLNKRWQRNWIHRKQFQLAYVSLAVWTAEMISVSMSQSRMLTLSSVQCCKLLIDVRLWRRLRTKLMYFPAFCLVFRLIDCNRCSLFSVPPEPVNHSLIKCNNN